MVTELDRVRIVTGHHCVQELIHALSRVLPVQKPELKLMEGGRQWESRHTAWEACAWPWPLDKPLVTPLWLQELLPKARLVPPALSFPLSTSQVRAEPCVYNPSCRSRVANAAPALLPPGTDNCRLLYCCVHDPYLWLAGKSCLMLP